MQSRFNLFCWVALLLGLPMCGCQWFAPQPPTAGGPLIGIGRDINELGATLAGPGGQLPGVTPSTRLFVPVTNHEVAWDHIADVVSNYFQISYERRVQQEGNIWTAGRLQTQFQSGATWLEPMRFDSVGRYNLWESTFQTIRRRATVNVMPAAAGYEIEVIVDKQIEDLPQPEHATAGSASFRTDGSLPDQRENINLLDPLSGRWISLGRDVALENKMLREIQARLVTP